MARNGIGGAMRAAAEHLARALDEIQEAHDSAWATENEAARERCEDVAERIAELQYVVSRAAARMGA